ncbi:MAG: hypothetical protein JXQ72_01825, partial [Anaerolineae bacterium]|nr:hypothetical protein [Anaerolineae bacterium]
MHLLSWTLLQRLNVLNHSSLENHPVCLREVDFPPAWKTIDRALGRLLVVVVFGVIGALIIGTQYDSVVVACLNGAACLLFPALIVAPSLALWTLPLGLTLGPVIVRERERQTWDTIRTIPLDLDLLLVCKARGALWWLVGGLRNLRVLLAFMGSIVGLGALLVLDTSVNLERQIDSDLLMFVIVVIVLTGGMLLFVFDRAQQLVLMCLAALVTSATSRSMRVAVAGAA